MDRRPPNAGRLNFSKWLAWTRALRRNPKEAENATLHHASDTRVDNLLDLPPLFTLVPGAPAIELVAYYPRFRDYYRACEPQTKRWFVENMRPDWRIFDIGANIGYYAILFSRLAPEGWVWAFEPTETIRMLQQNVAHAGCANVTAISAALGREEGERAEHVYRIWGEDPEYKTYPFTTVDRLTEKLGLDRLDCLKIDVDSFDFEVLQGSERTLERFDPWIVVELNHALAKRNQSAAAALEWLAAHGYGEALVLDAENYVLRRRVSKVSSDRRSIELIFDTRPVAFDNVPAND